MYISCTHLLQHLARVCYPLPLPRRRTPQEPTPGRPQQLRDVRLQLLGAGRTVPILVFQNVLQVLQQDLVLQQLLLDQQLHLHLRPDVRLYTQAMLHTHIPVPARTVLPGLLQLLLLRYLLPQQLHAGPDLVLRQEQVLALPCTRSPYSSITTLT